MSFATGFIPAKSLGSYAYFVLVSSLLSAICSVAVVGVKHRAITTGILFTIAATLGAFLSLPIERQLGFSDFAVIAAILGMGPMLITVPLTIHRSSSESLDNRSK